MSDDLSARHFSHCDRACGGEFICQRCLRAHGECFATESGENDLCAECEHILDGEERERDRGWGPCDGTCQPMCDECLGAA